MPERGQHCLTPAKLRHYRLRRFQEDAIALDPLSTILNAGLELAWAEHRREPLDEAELDALDLCDGIGEVRDIVAHEALHSRGGTRQGIENQEQDVNGHVLGMPRSVASVSSCHGAVCQRFNSSLAHSSENRSH